MHISYPRKNNGMYIIKKKEFDDLGEKVLSEFMPSALEYPRKVDILALATDGLYLDVMNKHITQDGSILGMIAFGETEIKGYDLNFEEENIQLPEGTVLVDYSLWGQEGRRRYTIAHECSHWICHRSYHAPDNRVYEFRRNKPGSVIACRSENIEGIRTAKSFRDYSDSDWEEWQADSLAAAILMPRKTFVEGFYEIMRKNGIRQNYLIKDDDRKIENCIIHSLMDIFGVSYTATEIRLKSLGLMREYSYNQRWGYMYL